MKKRQRNPSKNSITPPCKPVDFTVRSENGLGHLKRFPQEIRNIIYSSIIPSLMVNGLEHATIDRCVVHKFINAPILATSKQLCVEFLEVFIRDVNLEESNEYYDPRDPYDDGFEDAKSRKSHRCKHEQFPWSNLNSLEKLLAFVRARIGYAFKNKKVGLKINTMHLDPDIMGDVAEFRDCELSELPGSLCRLWNVHERYKVAPDQIYINIDYWEPSTLIQYVIPYNQQSASLPSGFCSHKFEKVSAVVTLTDEEASIRAMNDMSTKLRDQFSAYKVTRLHKLRKNNTSEDDYLVMERLVNWITDDFYKNWPVPEMLDFHIRMMKTAISFWKAKGERE
ncbi:hypothetical protein KCU91_g2280, partial [Aureobasidium melanogenum]